MKFNLLPRGHRYADSEGELVSELKKKALQQTTLIVYGA